MLANASWSRRWRLLVYSLPAFGVLVSVLIATPLLAGPAAQDPPPAGASSCLSHVTATVPGGSRPSPGWDAFWSGYGSSGAGWTAADGGYSVALPGLGELWMYADTYIGDVGPRGTLHAPPLIHNSFVLASSSGIHTYFRGTQAVPRSLVGGSHYTAYWPGPAIVTGSTLQVLFSEYHATEMSTITFLGSMVARFSLPSMSLLSLTPVPTPMQTMWSSWAFGAGGYTYIYGVQSGAYLKLMHIARVRGNDLLSRWQYWTGSRWSYSPASSAPVMSGVSDSLSVVRVDGVYVLVTMSTRSLPKTHDPSGNIDAYFSCSPAGPFRHRMVVYRLKSQLKGGVLDYNAIAHPELSHGRTLLVSYSVHGPTISMLGQPVSEYRPQYAWIKLPLHP